MVVEEIEGKKFTIEDISYGEKMDLRDQATVVMYDEISEKQLNKFLSGKFTRELILRCVKDENGDAVDINNKNQVSSRIAMILDTKLTELLKEENVKNTSLGQKEDSQSRD